MNKYKFLLQRDGDKTIYELKLSREKLYHNSNKYRSNTNKKKETWDAVVKTKEELLYFLFRFSKLDKITYIRIFRIVFKR